MATVFARMIRGGLPARFVRKDERCVAFLSINPIRSGHVLIIPKVEVDHRLDLDGDLLVHPREVPRRIGGAVKNGFQPTRIGLITAGLEVPYVHLLPIDGLDDPNFANAAQDPHPADLDGAADTVRRELAALRFREVAD